MKGWLLDWCTMTPLMSWPADAERIRSRTAAIRRPARDAAAILVSIFVPVCLLACSEDAPPNGPAPSPTTGFLAEPPCADCIALRCAGELRACNADGACHELYRCRAACDNAECDAECLAAQPGDGSARAIMNGLAVCAEFSCGAGCRGQPVLQTDVDECRQRFNEKIGAESSDWAFKRDCACKNCNAEWRECLDDLQCTSELACAMKCGEKLFIDPCWSAPGCLDPLPTPLSGVRAYLCEEHYNDQCLAREDGGAF
jgi:hypothetical protein